MPSRKDQHSTNLHGGNYDANITTNLHGGKTLPIPTAKPHFQNILYKILDQSTRRHNYNPTIQLL
jgi:hypothetical protein